MLPPATQRFQDIPCSVVVSNNYDTHGTITRASVAQLTPAQLQSLFQPGGLFADMDDWFRTAFEMKACGTKTNGMYDWLTSSQRNVGSLLSYEKVDRGPTLLKPFVLGKQDSVINKDFWAVVSGWANSAYNAGVTGPLTTGDLALGSASDRVIRVVNRYGMALDPKWFLNRDRVTIFGLSGGTSLQGSWKVLASEVSADLGSLDVLITDENSGSTTPYDAVPTQGVLLAGTNNVSDFEAFCQNRPTIDPRKRVPYWYKTDRYGRAIDSEYMKVFTRLMEANTYFQQFGDLPIAERNRQDEEERQKRWVNDFFYGKAISANQTLANYQNLEQILTVNGTSIDVGLSGKIVAYRANAIGIMEQLNSCGRVLDLQNTNLNMYNFLTFNYGIMRARKSQGRTVDTLDWWTDSVTAAQFETGFVNYLKAEYGDIVRINIETGTNELGFSWKIFTPKFPIGLKIAIVTHEFFDDMVNAFDTENIAPAGRVMWCLDIGKPGPKGGTIYPGMIASNKKMRTLGELDQLARIDSTFACTMEYITEQITLNSTTWTAICECPANSLVIRGLADGVPTTTGPTAPYEDLYGFLGFLIPAALAFGSLMSC